TTLMRRKEVRLQDKTLLIETGKMAKQADGAVTVRCGDTVVLVTVCAAKIPGGFFRREGRPNEKEVLTSRLIDRPLRPLFPSGWACETQVIALVLSADQENDPDVLALTGASFALAVSDIPFPSPIAAVRVGLSPAGDYMINPTYADLES